jgi:hypothetical protein
MFDMMEAQARIRATGDFIDTDELKKGYVKILSLTVLWRRVPAGLKPRATTDAAHTDVSVRSTFLTNTVAQ